MSKRQGELVHQAASGTGQVQNNGQNVFAFCRRSLRSITARGQYDHRKVGLSTDASQPQLTDSSCRQYMELAEVVKALSIGDRIRVLCDDGVVVAEKISQTQVAVIHCETMSELVH